ncbi:hypothetical protein COO60DRAFT_592778 [Scenedesmus sp. NREL 46B-D3]|nr:hypothetical protein COO60DRAFT_592778 [Scenedesmus sp. NREL 46B-D3]
MWPRTLHQRLHLPTAGALPHSVFHARMPSLPRHQPALPLHVANTATLLHVSTAFLRSIAAHTSTPSTPCTSWVSMLSCVSHRIVGWCSQPASSCCIATLCANLRNPSQPAASTQSSTHLLAPPCPGTRM